MLNLLILAIGKTREESTFYEIQKELHDFSCLNVGENTLLNYLDDGLTFTFNEHDVLIKIEIAMHQNVYQLIINQSWDFLKNSIHKTNIIDNLGAPTASMTYPIRMGAQEQILYNKENYWLSFKFDNEQLDGISLLLPSLISDSINKNFVPIRICKTKN